MPAMKNKERCDSNLHPNIEIHRKKIHSILIQMTNVQVQACIVMSVGNPWVISDLPLPLPTKTPTHSQGSG